LLSNDPKEEPVRIEAQAPTRIDLAGGTLDIWPLYLFHPGAVTVNCAVTCYARCTVETRSLPGRRIELISRDTGWRESFRSLVALARARQPARLMARLPLLADLVRFFAPHGPLRVTTDSEAPAGSGLGGSSALAVVLCAALDRLTGARLGRLGWIHLSRDIEARVISAPTGTQDHYPAAFGGASVIRLEPGGERREPLRTDLDELERRLVLCYTGKPRQSGINNWRVFVSHLEGDRRVWRNLEQIAAVARAMRAALEKRDWAEAGRLVREEWSFRRRNLPTISTPAIDLIIRGALASGALGGKACGAGGGGCVALLIHPEARARVERAVSAAGGRVLPVRIDRQGVRVRVAR
jgi:D-glycero-alpha-D-manno-heptose-7-phosphate kinase